MSAMIWCLASDIDNTFNLGVSTTPPTPPFTSDAVNSAIASASDLMEEKLSSRYVLPQSGDISAIPDDLERIAAVIAGYYLLIWRGFDSTNRQDLTYLKQYDECIARLKDIQENVTHPTLTLLDRVMPMASPYITGVYVDSGGYASQTRGTGRGL